jgi:hypothetical protein
MAVPPTPESIQPHQKDYHANAWDQYSLQELGHWVHLLAKRALHRSNREKAKKDIYDARNYLQMMQAKLTAAEVEIDVRPATRPEEVV